MTAAPPLPEEADDDNTRAALWPDCPWESDDVRAGRGYGDDEDELWEEEPGQAWPMRILP